MVITPETNFHFPRKLRLLRTADFHRVYKQRYSVASGPLILYGAEQTISLSHPRIGISVSRRVGNAVVRNQWKRRLREAFRQVRCEVAFTNVDVIVVVRATGKPAAGQKAAHDTEQDLVVLIKRVVAKICTSRREQNTC